MKPSSVFEAANWIAPWTLICLLGAFGCATWEVPAGEVGGGAPDGGLDASSPEDAPSTQDPPPDTGDCEPRLVRFDFEGAVALPPEFQTGGVLPWVVGSSGEGSYAESGPITHNQDSTLTLVVDFGSSAEVSFDYFTSSEASYDFLEFWVDDERVDRWSGETFWTRAQYTIPPGRRSLRWKYTKDGSQSPGQDLVRIDNLEYSTCEP